MVDELALAGVLLAALALISCLSVERRATIRRMPRAAWVAAILLIPLGGPVAWFLLGRPRTIGPRRTAWRVVARRPEPPRPRAPEDDPDFLRSLDQPGSTRPEPPPRQPPDDPGRREDEPRPPDREAG